MASYETCVHIKSFKELLWILRVILYFWRVTITKQLIILTQAHQQKTTNTRERERRNQKQENNRAATEIKALNIAWHLCTTTYW